MSFIKENTNITFIPAKTQADNLKEAGVAINPIPKEVTLDSAIEYYSQMTSVPELADLYAHTVHWLRQLKKDEIRER